MQEGGEESLILQSNTSFRVSNDLTASLLEDVDAKCKARREDFSKCSVASTASTCE